jgi:hypothetical protein
VSGKVVIQRGSLFPNKKYYNEADFSEWANVEDYGADGSMNLI